jgi:hypothetical protein
MQASGSPTLTQQSAAKVKRAEKLHADMFGSGSAEGAHAAMASEKSQSGCVALCRTGTMEVVDSTGALPRAAALPI